jgi:hypothetical protein
LGQTIGREPQQKWRPIKGEMTKMYGLPEGLQTPVALILLPGILLKRHSTQALYEVQFIDSGKLFKLDRLWYLYFGKATSTQHGA